VSALWKRRSSPTSFTLPQADMIRIVDMHKEYNFARLLSAKRHHF
jgi:hypothetical protein